MSSFQFVNVQIFTPMEAKTKNATQQAAAPHRIASYFTQRRKVLRAVILSGSEESPHLFARDAKIPRFFATAQNDGTRLCGRT